jgi:MFS family permease
MRGDTDVRRWLAANAAWEGAFAAERTFVVLYLTRGLGQSLPTSSAVLGTVAAGYVIAAVFSGPLGDRVGLARVIFVASFIYGAGLLVAGLATSWQNWYLALIFPVAIAGGAVMTLAWGLLFILMPEGQRGAIAGLATWTKGFGLLAGPLIAGALIDVLSPYLPSTDGYQVLWPICAVPILAVIPLVALLMRAEARNRASGRTA